MSYRGPDRDFATESEHTAYWKAAAERAEAKLAAAEKALVELQGWSPTGRAVLYSEVMAERDVALARVKGLEVYREANERNAIRLEEAQARVAALEGALRYIADLPSKPWTDPVDDAEARWNRLHPFHLAVAHARRVLEGTK